MPIALLAVLLDRTAENCHLGVTEWRVLWRAEIPIFDMEVEPVHVPRVVKQLHGRDAVFDAVVGTPLPVPVCLALLDDVFEFSKISVAVRGPNRFPVAIQFRFLRHFFDFVSSAFVCGDAL